MTKREKVVAALEALGYTPQIDNEGDVMLRYQMKCIYVLVGDEDDNYVSVTLPQFYEIEDGEETLAMAVCNKMTREIKQAKTFIDQTLQNVSASCEFFYTDEECLKECLAHALDILGVIRSAFMRAKAELSEE